MYFNSRYVIPEHETKYLRLEKPEKFWFSHLGKYLAWLLIGAIAITSTVVQVYYGISYGLLKTYLWLAGTTVAFLVGLFFISPARIGAFVLLDTLFFRFRVTVRNRRFLYGLLRNEDDPKRRKNAKALRQSNRVLYKRMTRHKLKNRLQDVKFKVEVRNLMADGAGCILFILTLFFVIHFFQPVNEYYSTEVVRNLVVEGTYTNSVPFTEVTTYEKLLQYLKETLLPALMTQCTAEEKHFLLHALNERNRLINEAREGRSLRFNDTNIFDRGWTADPTVKLIGVPRLRQSRVTAESCLETTATETRRDRKCGREMSLRNDETGDFATEWSSPPDSPVPGSDHRGAWTHKTGKETDAMALFARYASYPSGGYVLTLARSERDSRILVDYMDAFRWVDELTRAIFVEFTVYCVNTNVFGIVTLIAERTATGYLVPSFKIETCKLLILFKEIEFLYSGMAILVAFLLLYHLFREGLRIRRTSLREYFSRGSSLTNAVILIYGLCVALATFLRTHYVVSLLKRLQMSNNNAFVSFIYAARWSSWFTYLGALLIGLVFFKLVRLLMIGLTLYKFRVPVSDCLDHFVRFAGRILVLAVAFLLFSQVSPGRRHVDEFGVHTVSPLDLTDRFPSWNDALPLQRFLVNSWFISAVHLVFFYLVLGHASRSAFLAVVCFYVRMLSKELLTDRYNLKRHLKRVIAQNQGGDLFFPKTKSEEPNGQRSLLRLRGGGNWQSKKPNAKKRRKKAKQEPPAAEFTVKKRLDATRYWSLSSAGESLMRALSAAVLRDDRPTAVKVVFLSLTRTAHAAAPVSGSSSGYFTVLHENAEEMCDKAVLTKIKRIVEKVEREKLVETPEGEGGECFSGGVVDKFDELLKKLNSLTRH